MSLGSVYHCQRLTPLSYNFGLGSRYLTIYPLSGVRLEATPIGLHYKSFSILNYKRNIRFSLQRTLLRL